MLIIEMARIELTGGHIEFMLILEMAKIELTGGHIGFIAIYIDSQIGINWRPYWIILIYTLPK